MKTAKYVYVTLHCSGFSVTYNRKCYANDLTMDDAIKFAHTIAPDKTVIVKTEVFSHRIAPNAQW